MPLNGNPVAETDLVLLDIDGVVANDSHRVEYALRKDWGTYFERVSQDVPLSEGHALAWEAINRPHTEVQYLTGRRIDLYEKTKSWLIQHNFPVPFAITMRGFAHKSILAKYKEGVVRSAIESGRFRSVTLYEDDPAAVAHLNNVFGEGTGILCDWYKKSTEMIKYAEA